MLFRLYGVSSWFEKFYIPEKSWRDLKHPGFLILVSMTELRDRKFVVTYRGLGRGQWVIDVSGFGCEGLERW